MMRREEDGMPRRPARSHGDGVAITVVAALAIALVACIERPPEPSLTVRGPWARPADSAATTAAYFVIVNHQATTVSLTSASSPVAESVTLHESMKMNGMVHMAALDAQQPIVPGDSLVLTEGAKHMMVAGLKRAVAAGDSLPLDLRFSDGRVLRVSAAVRAP